MEEVADFFKIDLTYGTAKIASPFPFEEGSTIFDAWEYIIKNGRIIPNAYRSHWD